MGLFSKLFHGSGSGSPPENINNNGIDYSVFRTENWSNDNLDLADKLDYLQKVENESAKAQGREPRWVMFDDNISNGGYYQGNGQGGGMIKVSTNDLERENGYECLDTVFHEGRHAYQDDVINNRIPNNESAETVSSWAHDDEKGTYLSSSDDHYCDYFYQSQERDAYGYAGNKMDSLSNCFGDDPGYGDYIANRDYNRSLAFAEAKKVHGVTNEADAAKAADDLVEDRYSGLHNQESDAKEDKASAESEDTGNGVKNDTSQEKQRYRDADENDYNGNRNGNVYRDDHEEDFANNEEDSYQRKGLIYGGNGTVTVTEPTNNRPESNQSPDSYETAFLNDYEKNQTKQFDEGNYNTPAEQKAERPATDEDNGQGESAQNDEDNAQSDEDVETLDNGEDNGQDESAQSDEDNARLDRDTETLDIDEDSGQDDSVQNGEDNAQSDGGAETLDNGEDNSQDNSVQNDEDNSRSDGNTETSDTGENNSQGSSDQNGMSDSGGEDSGGEGLDDDYSYGYGM